MSTQSAPYPASWVDRLIDRIDALPGPAWVPYVVVMVVVTLVVNAAAWIDGLVPLGTFDLFLSSLGVYVVVSVAAIHVLDLRAAMAWTAFRPIASVTGDQADRVGFELTTLPARAALGWTTAGLAFAVLTLIPAYGTPIDIEGEPVTLLVTATAGAFGYMSGAVLIYHTIRQLRLVSGLPGYVERIDLLDAGPLHAFSGVTALTGVFFLVAAYFSALTDPTTFTNPAVAAVNGAAVILGVVCFVLPLYGMHQRIVAEKDRRSSAVSRRLDAALQDLANRNDARDLSDADAVNKNINSLIAEREVIATSPTWPWSTETLRGFSTALLLPIFLWLVFRVLERALG